MKTLITFAAIVFAVCIVGSPSVAAAQWPQATSHEPVVTIELGGAVFDREGLGDSLIVATDDSTQRTLLTGERATDLGSAAGVQGKIVFPSRRTLQTFELRGSYSGWDKEFEIFNGNLSTPFLIPAILQVAGLTGIDAANPINPLLPVGITPADLSIPTIPLSSGDVSALSLVMPELPTGFTVDGLAGPDFEEFYDVSELRSRYRSDYFSVELMSRRNTRPGVTWLFGPRFISVSEEMEINTVGQSPARLFNFPDTLITPVGDVASVAGAKANTRNSLVGLQLGMEFNFPVTQDVYFQAMGRAGVFYNGTSVARSAAPLLPMQSVNAGVFSSQVTDSGSSEAYLAEFTARGYVDVIPNVASLYAGFELIYIDQLALAPAQLASLNTIEDSGELFARGLSFGLKMNY